jgi:hypothetical protein
MGTISLPMVAADISLDDAISKMKTASRSGVVWQRSLTEFLIFKASDVVIARSKRGNTYLSQLQGESVDTPDIAEIAGSTPGPFIQLEKVSTALRSTNSNFALLAVDLQEKAFVFTSALNLISKLEPGPSDCYCERCHEPVPKGQKCPIDDILPICKE